MKKLFILLSLGYGLSLTPIDAQTTPKNSTPTTPSSVHGAVTHRRQHGLVSVSETTAKGGSKGSTTVKETAKEKTAPSALNGNKSAQDKWDGK